MGIRTVMTIIGAVALLILVFFSGVFTAGTGATAWLSESDVYDKDGNVYHFEVENGQLRMKPGSWKEFVDFQMDQQRIRRQQENNPSSPGTAKTEPTVAVVDPAPGKKFCYVPEFKMTVVRADEEGNWKEWRP